MASKLFNRIAAVGAGVSAAGAAAQFCLYTVDGGERAVIYHRFNGVEDDVQGEGTHFRMPWIHYPYIFNVRMRPRVISSRTGTKDLQQVTISLRVLSRPIPEHLPGIFKQIGEDWDERILPSICNEVLKATVAQFDAEKLLTEREKVSKQIREALDERAVQWNIILDDVSITHLTFGREFTKAIESKQVAQQDAERSKFVVLKAEREKEASIIRAHGESEAADKISKALAKHGTGLIDVKRIDAARDIAKTLARSRNVTYLPSNESSGILLNMNNRA